MRYNIAIALHDSEDSEKFYLELIEALHTIKTTNFLFTILEDPDAG